MKISGEADDLATRGVMLAQPNFVEAKSIEMFDEFQVPLHGKRRIGTCSMKRCDEIPKSQLGHGRSPSSRVAENFKPARQAAATKAELVAPAIRK